MGFDGDELDKQYMKALTRANRELKGLAMNAGEDQARILRGEDPTASEEYRALLAAGEAYVAHAVAGWAERIIRRDNRSKASDGVTSITQGVPPLTIVDAYVLVSDDELCEIEDAVARVEERRVAHIITPPRARRADRARIFQGRRGQRWRSRVQGMYAPSESAVPTLISFP